MVDGIATTATYTDDLDDGLLIFWEIKSVIFHVI
jgi:hypothetical protein